MGLMKIQQQLQSENDGVFNMNVDMDLLIDNLKRCDYIWKQWKKGNNKKKCAKAILEMDRLDILRFTLATDHLNPVTQTDLRFFMMDVLSGGYKI